MSECMIQLMMKTEQIIMDKYEATNARSTSSDQFLFQLKPRKKRMSGSWGGEEEDADEVEFTDTDEVKCQYAQWNDSITHGLHATRCQKACRADYKRRTSMKKTRGKITPCDVIIFLKEKKKKKP